jgi:hypothetical protein
MAGNLPLVRVGTYAADKGLDKSQYCAKTLISSVLIEISRRKSSSR